MKTLEKGKDKVQHICDILRKETLEPAQLEAEKIIGQAKKEAEAIVKKAEENADKLVAAGRECIERERSVFQSSLEQAGRQGLEAFRQDIENKLFNDQLVELIDSNIANPEIVGQLVSSIVSAIEKEGIGADLSVSIPSQISAEAVNALLAQDILKKMRKGSVQVGNFTGGAQVKIHDQRITIDISDGALRELLSNYLRKDFRKFMFKN